METSLITWRDIFGTGVAKILKRLVGDCSKIADNVIEKIGVQVEENGLSLSADLVQGVRRGFELQLTDMLKVVERDIDLTQRQSWKLVSRSIRQSLTVGYTLGGAERGTGCVARLKAIMQREVEQKRMTMFRTSLTVMKSALVSMLTKFAADVKVMVSRYAAELLRSVEIVWDSDCDLTTEECGKLVEAITELKNFIQNTSTGSFALKAAIKNIDFDQVGSNFSVLPKIDDLVLTANRTDITTFLIDSAVIKNVLRQPDHAHSKVKAEPGYVKPEPLWM
ncbi:hypothetical protein BCR33DRAFT_732485 [Rhizoclosmatium globosum]|uniref:Uncharacterized protein n=1 Tax=Rhizoclosmatium globosum TaxID=329046 RepID=A0A1Y2D502_9FUNG|nr:hypothetical protein BCR33DRAFT_732485 [Rhizoclosmatium globosum]|eukprot:ORY53655.1 hypothetical protein BCR33DRAFT_732485 [Rhizoclosmatium globosum]